MNARRFVTLIILVTAIFCAWPQASFATPTMIDTDGTLLKTAAAAPVTARCANPYTARYGDTVLTIATRCGVNPSMIMQLNGLRTYRIWPGQRLYIAPITKTPVTKTPIPKAVATPRIEPRIQP